MLGAGQVYREQGGTSRERVGTPPRRKSLFSAWRRRVARRTGRPQPSRRAQLTAPPEPSAAARAARAISLPTQVRTGLVVVNNSNSYIIIINTLNIIMHKMLRVNLRPKVPKPVVATRVATLFVHGAANVDRFLGFPNMRNMLLCSMQPFVIMENMIKKESMIELKAHVFSARQTRRSCAPRPDAPPSPAAFLRPCRASRSTSAVLAQLACVRRNGGRR